ncbi:MAG: WG repeat-containing protein [Planctomycetaceae bacterium]|nr:WG repeat-containing protein [Planctomycetaceae bacterium]
MNVPSASDRQRAVDFLESDARSLDDTNLSRDLEASPPLRQFLEQTAASPDEWSRIRQHLKPTEFDRASRVDDSAASVTPTTAGQPLAMAMAQVLQALSPTDDPHRLGRLGTYEITGVVGAGGMGVVLKAVDPSLDRVVAVKVMAPSLANNTKARRRFSREAKAAAAVLHPNVVPIHSVSSDETMPYLVMAYIRGGSLQKRIEAQGPLPVVEILRIGAQIAAGLAAAHEQGLVHRDIKPENILLEEGVERVTITDFGLARAVDDNTVTQNGAIAGTPMYMSPEQAAGQPVDQQSDLFSLGSVLYSLCTGQAPYSADSSWGVMRQIIDETPRPVSEANPDIPVWLSDIVQRLMARDKSERFASAAEVRDLLESCLGHVQQPDTTALPAITPLTGPPTHSAVLAPRPRARRSRYGWLLSLAAVAAVICAAVVWSQRQQSLKTAYKKLHTYLQTGEFAEHPLNHIDTLLAGGRAGHEFLSQLDAQHDRIVFATGEFLNGERTVAGIVTTDRGRPQLKFRFVSPHEQGGSSSTFPGEVRVRSITIEDGPNYRRNVCYTVTVTDQQPVGLVDAYKLQPGATYTLKVPLTDRLDSQIDWANVWQTAAQTQEPAGSVPPTAQSPGPEDAQTVPARFPPVLGSAVIAMDDDQPILQLTLPLDTWKAVLPQLDGEWPALQKVSREDSVEQEGRMSLPLTGRSDQPFWIVDRTGVPFSPGALREKLADSTPALVSVDGRLPHPRLRNLPSPAEVIVMLGPCDHGHHENFPDPIETRPAPELTVSAAESQAYYFLLLQKAQSFQLKSDEEAAAYIEGIWRLDRKAHFGGGGHYVRSDRGDNARAIITSQWLVKSLFNDQKPEQVSEDVVAVESIKRGEQGLVINDRHRFMAIDKNHMAIIDYDFLAVMERVAGAEAESAAGAEPISELPDADDEGVKPLMESVDRLVANDQPEPRDEQFREPPNKRGLFKVTVNGRDGFINSDGEIVLPPAFEKAYPFTEGLAAVQLGGRWGFITPAGRMAIEPRFVSVGPFASGRAVVQLDSFEDQFGYIDTKGRVVIKPQFDRAEPFVNGIAKVGNATTAGKFLSRLADVGVETDERYIDVTGREVARPAPQYAGTGAPNELIPFSADDKMGYVNADGKTVIAPRFHSCGPFVDGLALACEDTQFGYIDRTGRFVIPPRFQYANDFADGLAGVQLTEGKWGFIDRRGNTVIEPKFDWIYGGFREGIAQVTVAGRLGYVNKRGEWVW